MPIRPASILSFLAAVSLGTGAAHASSGDAWEEFRADVSAKCIAAAESLEDVSAIVDPFGTESYGVALVSGKPKGGDGNVTQICVYDKRTKAVELGGEIGAQVIPVSKP
ncbi:MULTISPECIES: hypothetical protein [unclassified Sinorhizobium]|uniref:hypothetical protein n=1 Tax=unclassified Sinorhizobium TaxID=2613772 RepID=UPI0024C24F68|nr:MULTISPECIES: hypothetical protein [unclassified Sinorhizobium]MDK1375625.1 hypothetical protein [Sinorhizobium sp. 6-70]MDK1479518.1 hypothetical protein [Sinorhizobium sp. 6-117]